MLHAACRWCKIVASLESVHDLTSGALCIHRHVEAKRRKSAESAANKPVEHARTPRGNRHLERVMSPSAMAVW
eukprot:1765508-Alexandrium_andersonii.AAC.1